MVVIQQGIFVYLRQFRRIEKIDVKYIFLLCIMGKLTFVKAKPLTVPPVNLSPCSLTEEAFENIRQWRLDHGETPTQDDLKWYYNVIEIDKKEQETYFQENPTYKAMLDSVEKGYSDEQRELAEKAVRKEEPLSDDPGPMPEYGSKEFWAWCRRRKEIRLKKEAAIIAAGGTVPPPKIKKAKK